ncbi:MAG: acyltransferase, partial [Lachnospiraceae bacterium]|nr:acyltransferase [Lachnospiraceae bacterium]
NMEKRQSNFELLRILCMLLIMGIHITTQTAMDGIKINDSINYYYVTLIGSAGRLVCNTFVIIGAWFLVDSDFKPERVVNLWLEILIYAVPITIVCLFVGCENASLTTLIQAFFPVFGRPVWFGAEYICLLLLTPWLNMMLKEQNIRWTKKVVILFGILIIGCATLFPIEHTTPAFSELIWFCFLYLLTGMYKHDQIHISRGLEKYSFLCFIVCYLALCGVKVLADYTGMRFLSRLYVYYRIHYEAVPGFICSVFLFLTFKNWNIRYCRPINLISRSTFAVYIIHQTPAFYRYMWNGIFHVNEAVKNDNVILYSLIVIVTIFIVCVVIDQLRILFMKKVICLSKIYRITCEKIAKFYKE